MDQHTVICCVYPNSQNVLTTAETIDQMLIVLSITEALNLAIFADSLPLHIC